MECSKQAFLAYKEQVVQTLTDVEWLDLEELEEKEKIEMFEAEKRWLEVRLKG